MASFVGIDGGNRIRKADSRSPGLSFLDLLSLDFIAGHVDLVLRALRYTYLGIYVSVFACHATGLDRGALGAQKSIEEHL